MKCENKNLLRLPVEIIMHCFSYLTSPKDLVSLTKTNHGLRLIAFDQSLWRKHSNILSEPRVKYVRREGRPIEFTAFAELENGYLASGNGKTIWILETIRFRCVKKIKLTSKINVLATLPNNRLAIGCKNGTIEIWRLICVKFTNKTKNPDKYCYQEKIIQVAHNHRNFCAGITAIVSLSDCGLVSGGCCNSSIYLWDIISGQIIQHYDGHKYKVTVLAALPDKKIVSGSFTKFRSTLVTDRVRIWSVNTGKCIKVLEEDIQFNKNATNKYVKDLQILPDNKLAIYRIKDGIRIYDTISGKFIRKLVSGNLENYPLRLTLLHSNYIVGWNFRDNHIYVWDINSGNTIQLSWFTLHRESKWTHYTGKPYEHGNLIVLKDGRLVCGKSGECIHVFSFPSIPENKLLNSDRDKHKVQGACSYKQKQI